MCWCGEPSAQILDQKKLEEITSGSIGAYRGGFAIGREEGLAPATDRASSGRKQNSSTLGRYQVSISPRRDHSLQFPATPHQEPQARLAKQSSENTKGALLDLRLSLLLSPSRVGCLSPSRRSTSPAPSFACGRGCDVQYHRSPFLQGRLCSTLWMSLCLLLSDNTRS